MNEKITELAKQAGIIGQSENNIALPMELFAELIVKECSAVALNIGCGDIEDELLKHFGVE